MGLDKFIVACSQNHIKQLHPKDPLGPSNLGFSWVVSSPPTLIFIHSRVGGAGNLKETIETLAELGDQLEREQPSIAAGTKSNYKVSENMEGTNDRSSGSRKGKIGKRS